MSASEDQAPYVASPIFTHFVFVDHENVPDADLSLVAGRRMHVTVLAGKNQNSFGIDLVHAIEKNPGQIHLEKVGVSGRNALDLALAFHLGQTARDNPGAHFVIVSKDKGFDSLVTHVRALGIRIDRVEAFVAPGDSAPKKKLVAPASPGPKKTAPAIAKPDRSAKVIAQLKSKTTTNRPGTLAKLRAKIKTDLSKDYSEAKVTSLIERLKKDGTLTIDANDKVMWVASSALNPS